MVAVSPVDAFDFEAFVGHAAGFTIHVGAGGRGRGWTGVCNHFEQRGAEEKGLSTYLLRIVPALWLATQRHDCRIFQHLTVPAIVQEVLAGHHIEAELRLDAQRYPAQEYRVQYASSDSPSFQGSWRRRASAIASPSTQRKGSALVLAATIPSPQPRPGGPIAYLDRPSPGAHAPCITQVSAGREIARRVVAFATFTFGGGLITRSPRRLTVRPVWSSASRTTATSRARS